MLKPTGTLEYNTVTAGGGATSVVNVLLTDDVKGNHFVGPIPIEAVIEARAVVTGLTTAASDGGRLRCEKLVGLNADGDVATLSIRLTNDSAAAGDIVSAILYVTVNNRAGMAV